ncbi:unnamed protein product [Durusdinium trenchii]|uniref:Uncharacterized protein n=1 Tax=Durusdinium trenchii TaxID=1381693 RepID=A0ABP0JJ38_9DINO
MKRKLFETPPEEHLAWVDSSTSGGTPGDCWLRCLLCQRWVQDKASHSDGPEASKLHKTLGMRPIRCRWKSGRLLFFVVFGCSLSLSLSLFLFSILQGGPE